MHPLLERQLREAGIAAGSTPTAEGWRVMVELLDRAYTQADSTRGALEQSVHRVALVERDTASRLAEERNKLETIIASIGDGLCALDMAGRLQSMNAEAERLLLWRESQLGGQCLLDIVLDHKDDSDRAWRDAIEQGRRFKDEARFRRKDGVDFPVSYALNPMIVGGQTIGSVLVFRDIRERRALEQSLIEARDAALAAAHAKNEFLAMMSHEIRTPLNGVIGMTTLLLDTQLTEEQREYGEIATSSAEALLALVNDILDFSKIEAHEMGLEVIEYDLSSTVEDVLDLLAHDGQRKGLEMASWIDPAVPASLFGDPYRLRQILLNLVGNAVKFTERGSITVTAKLLEAAPDSVRLRFEVKDTGIGIPPQAMRRLFSPFTQADSSTTRRHGGTGLGLAICKKLTALMGGDIGISSRPGQGSTFWFTVRQKPAKLAAPEGFAVPAAAALVIDDSQPIAEFVAEQLRAWGMEVQIACGGREAIALAQAAADRGRPFALALVDRSLPDLDSSTLAGGLQASGTPHLVLMTQLADRANHPHDPRFVAQVHKPVRRRVLHAAVCSALRPDAAAHDPRPNTTAGLSMSLPPRARALVADDNLVNQKVAVHMLARLGFAVDIAHDGADAVAAADNTAYDVILMDCQMPHMDGFEATRRIRSSGANRRSPIIALTANALDANNKRCADAGMNECLTKPVKLGELARTLERWMKKG